MILASSQQRRGFTLIELLVVIAIIGILSAVVLASLNQARVKGNYAQLKSDLSTIQTQAEVFYDNNGQSYGPTLASTTGTTCSTSGMFGDTTISNAIKQIQSIPGVTALQCGIGASGSFYDVNVTDSVTGNWCVNSTGIATATNSC